MTRPTAAGHDTPPPAPAAIGAAAPGTRLSVVTRHAKRLAVAAAVGTVCSSAVLSGAAPRAAAATMPPVPGQLNAVTALSSTNAWAVGLTQSSTVLVEHWNGSVWNQVAAPSPGYVNQLAAVSATSASDVWAVGTQFYSGSTEYYNTLVEHYDGASWSVVPSPNFGVSSYLTGVTAIAPDNVWAVGWVEQHGTGDRTLIEHYDGTRWSRVASPNPVSSSAAAARTYLVDTLAGVWASGPSDVWAVGAYYPASNNNFESPLILHWAGHGWQQVANPVMPGGARESYLDAVSGSTGGDVTAVGALYTTHWMSLIEHWDGSSWQVVPSPNPAGSNDTQLFATTARAATATWAVGNDASVGGISERLGAQGWSLVSLPGSGYLLGVSATAGNDAWAVGAVAFGNYVYIEIEHWNGTRWTELTSFP